jgi:hypothetical protein
MRSLREKQIPEEDECRHGGNTVSSSGVLALVHVNLRTTFLDSDPNPEILVSFQDINNNKFSLRFFCILLFQGTFTSIFKEKSYKSSLMIEGFGSQNRITD